VSLWLSLLIGTRIEGVGGASALKLKTAARSELPLELHHAAAPEEAIIVGVAAARIEHAHTVDDGCNGRAKPALAESAKWNA
jgi:hypothetical protein